MLPGITQFLHVPITPSSVTYDTPGTYTFDVTLNPYNEITIEAYGAGGGGAFYNTGSYAPGSAGGAASVAFAQGTLQANGGQGGIVFGSASAGGTASGPAGAYTETGGSSAQSQAPTGGTGAGPGGGAGGYWYGTPNGSAPGGGGAAYSTNSPGGNYRSVSGGGGGGYARYITTDYVGNTLTITVPSGGAGEPASSYGANGRVKISWS